MATLVWLAARHLHIDAAWLLQGVVAAGMLCAWWAVFDHLRNLDGEAGEALLEAVDRQRW